MKGYTNKTELENYMGIDIDSVMDAQITNWISDMEAYVDKMTNRDFTVAITPTSGDDGVTEKVYDGDKTDTLLVDPFVELDTLVFDDSDEPVDSENIVLYPANKTVKTKIVLKNLRFPCGKQNISVNARFGYDEVPADIRFATTVLVSGIINNNFTSEEEIQSITIGRYSVSYKNKSQINDFERVKEILSLNRKYTV